MPRDEKRSPTQKDVAHIAGVSQATVSYVLMGGDSAPTVSDEVRRKVQDAARLLNYRPNAMARAMRERRFFHVGYFTANVGAWDFDYSSFRSGVYDGAAEQNYHVLSVQFPATPDARRSVPRIFSESRLDTLVVNPMGNLPETLRIAIDRSNLPIVYLNDNRRANAVYVDDKLGASMMTEHLLAQGYRRIAYVREAAAHRHSSEQLRWEGYCEAVTAAGLQPLLHEGITGDRQRFFVEFVTGPEKPDAIFFYNDPQLVIARAVLYASGVPLSQTPLMAGYNEDEHLADLHIGTVPTVSIPRYEMAKAAVRMAISLVDMPRGTELPAVRFTPELREIHSHIAVV